MIRSRLSRFQIVSAIALTLLIAAATAAWGTPALGGERHALSLKDAEGALPFRAILAIHSDPAVMTTASGLSRFEGAFFADQEWEQYLTMWRDEGFNAVVWMGANEFITGDHRILRHDEFPEARELSPERNEAIIEQMTWLFRLAKELGMKNYLYTTSISYTNAFRRDQQLGGPPPQFAGRNQDNIGVRNEVTRAYTEAIFAEALEIYPDLDGFYSPMAETIDGDKSTFFKEAIVPALERSGRKPHIIVHQWQVPLELYMENIAPKSVYDNTWLGFHGWNAEQITDAKPYPSLVEWAETTGLPTVAAVYPANVTKFPFNSPRLAYEIAREMRKVENFAGFVYWEHSGRKLSPLFRKALAYYTANDVPYSDEPWLALIEEEYGSREAARYFLEAFDISARIMPEKDALVYSPGDVLRREIRLPYAFLTGQYTFSWTTSPARGRMLIPVAHFARILATSPETFLGNNGSDPNRWPYQGYLWGNSAYDVLPFEHMAKVAAMGEAAYAAALEALRHVQRNHERAEQTVAFMKGYQLLARYFDLKVQAAVWSIVYAEAGREEDRLRAESYANQALESYLEAAAFMKDPLTPILMGLYNEPFRTTMGVSLDALIREEIDERERLAEIFRW